MHVKAHAAATGADEHGDGGSELDGCCVSLNVFSQARVTAAASRVLGVPPPSLPGGGSEESEDGDGQRWSAYVRLVQLGFRNFTAPI